MMSKPIILDCNELTGGSQHWSGIYLERSHIIFKNSRLGIKLKPVLLHANFGY